MFQTFTDSFIEAQDISRLQALTIGGIGHDDGLVLWLGKFAEVLLLEDYHIGHSGLFGIGHSSFECRTIDVVGKHFMSELALG